MAEFEPQLGSRVEETLYNMMEAEWLAGEERVLLEDLMLAAADYEASAFYYFPEEGDDVGE